jgi:thiol:disulfide interchange protein DsbD
MALMRPHRILVATVLSCALAVTAAAQDLLPPRKINAPHVTVELIAARPALVPGGDTWLGLRFIIERGWHLYWVNPGDSGGPPTVLWTPAPGLSAGEFEWPAPERIPYGQLVNYGYHGDLVLPFKVTAARGTTSGTLQASVTWLVCLEVCVSGKGRVAATFPLAADAAAASPAWQQMIDEARAKVPRAAPSPWRAKAAEGTSSFAVELITGRRETGATFFPLDTGVIDDAAPQNPEPLDRGLRLTLKKSDLLTKSPSTLRGVVALGSGATHTVSIPVHRSASEKGRTP